MQFEDLAVLWWFLLYGVMVFIVVACIRRTVETFWPKVKDNKVWRDWALFMLPPVIGGVAALFLKQFPILEGIEIPWIRVGLGMTAGFCSGAVYKFVRARAKTKGLDLPDIESATPTAVTQTVTETKTETALKVELTPKPETPEVK